MGPPLTGKTTIIQLLSRVIAFKSVVNSLQLKLKLLYFLGFDYKQQYKNT